MYRNNFDVECCIALYVSTPYNYNVNSKKNKIHSKTNNKVLKFWFQVLQGFQVTNRPWDNNEARTFQVFYKVRL